MPLKILPVSACKLNKPRARVSSSTVESLLTTLSMSPLLIESIRIGLPEKNEDDASPAVVDAELKSLNSSPVLRFTHWPNTYSKFPPSPFPPPTNDISLSSNCISVPDGTTWKRERAIFPPNREMANAIFSIQRYMQFPHPHSKYFSTGIKPYWILF